MKKSLAIGAATLAAVLSLGLAACGSSDDDSSSSDTSSTSDNTAALTKQQLITQADAICTKYNGKLVKLQQESGLDSTASDDQVVSFITDDIIPLYEDQIDELRALQPDDADADAYNEIIDTLDSEVQDVDSDPEAAMDQDNPFKGSTAKAKEFGLKVCGEA